MPDLDPEFALRRIVKAAAEGPGALDADTRRRALGLEELPEPLGVYVQKLATGVVVTGEDVGNLREAGYSQDAVIELTVCTALGIAHARLKAGLAALEEVPAW
jgi:alkylhydroperoxidase family enzyme